MRDFRQFEVVQLEMDLTFDDIRCSTDARIEYKWNMLAAKVEADDEIDEKKKKNKENRSVFGGA